MPIRTSVPARNLESLTLLQRLDRWLWQLEAQGRERYLARASDRFDLEQRIRHIDRGGAFWFS